MKLKILNLVAAVVLMTGAAVAQPADGLVDPGLTPDSPFYFVEKISESLEMAVATAPVIGSEELAAKVRANHAEERLAEARAMMERNKTEKAEQLLDRYQDLMNRSAQTARQLNDTDFRQRLSQVNSRHVEVLDRTREKAPPRARLGLETALENSKGRARALETPGSEDRPGKGAPRDTTPGPLEDIDPGQEGNPGAPPENTGNRSGETGQHPDRSGKRDEPGENTSQEQGAGNNTSDTGTGSGSDEPGAAENPEYNGHPLP